MAYVTTPKPGVAPALAAQQNAGGTAGMAPGPHGPRTQQQNVQIWNQAVARNAANAATINGLTPQQKMAFGAWVNAQQGGAGNPTATTPTGVAPVGQGATGVAPPGGTPGGVALSSPQEAIYQGQQNSINEGANSQLATNVYQQGATRTNFNAQQQQNAQLQLQERNQMYDPYVQRGIAGSGIQQAGITNLFRGESQRSNTILQARKQAMYTLISQHQQIENARNSALADLRARHQAAVNAQAEGQVK